MTSRAPYQVDTVSSNAQLNEIEERFCEALGFHEHQRISVVHDDTDNLHIHIAINKIHPRKLTIHNPYYDYKKVATLCEQIEQEYGLTQVNHETKLDKSARIIQDIEAKAGVESLLGWIRRECLDDIKQADAWQDLHQVLQNHGLEIISIICSCGSLDKTETGIPGEHKIIDPDTFEAACNPLLQAKVLNRLGTSFNILVGLCIGHDMLFTQHSESPVTTFIVKDRLTGHNPVISLYTRYHRHIR